MAFDRICVASSSSGSGIRSGESRKGTRAPDEGVCRAGSGSELGLVPQVDGLRGHHELDRDDACAEVEHLREPPRSERRQRRPVLDARLLHRRGELERDGLGEQPRLGDDRLRRDAELGEPVLPRSLGRGQAFREPAEARADELQRSFDCGRQHGRECDPEEVERGGELRRLEVPHRHDSSSETTTSGFPWWAFSSTASVASTYASASRNAPWSWGTHRKLSGSWRKRACSFVPEPAALELRHAGGRACRAFRGVAGPRPPPGGGPRRCRAALRSRVPRLRRATSANARASATASAACAVEYAFVASSAPASPAARAKSASAPWARSAFCARSASPTVPERSHLRLRAVVQRRTRCARRAPDGRPGIRRRASSRVAVATRARRREEQEGRARRDARRSRNG